MHLKNKIAAKVKRINVTIHNAQGCTINESGDQSTGHYNVIFELYHIWEWSWHSG